MRTETKILELIDALPYPEEKKELINRAFLHADNHMKLETINALLATRDHAQQMVATLDLTMLRNAKRAFQRRQA